LFGYYIKKEFRIFTLAFLISPGKFPRLAAKLGAGAYLGINTILLDLKAFFSNIFFENFTA